MTLSIEALRKMRNTDFSQITDAIEKIASPQGNYQNQDDDPRIWKLTKDKTGNGWAEIRFLPKTEEDELPWARVFSHGFQGPTGKWYIENCLSTFNEPDPVNEHTYALRKTGLESDKALAQQRGRRTNYYSNILVINDPANPDNNNKVFIFKFGQKIFDKIKNKSKPPFPDQAPINIFDLWEGANFKLRMCQVGGFPNYDQSEFASQSALFDGDETKLLETLNSRHRLSEFLDRKHFKSYEELSRKFQSVINPELTAPVTTSAGQLTTTYSQPSPAVTTPTLPNSVADTPATPASNSDADLMSYFQSLADQD